MELRHLRTFQMVAHTLSFTQAAAALGYAQSNVTAHIQSLEGELNVLLFNRLGKRISLTEAGERLLPYAEQVLAIVDQARSLMSAGDRPAGTLTLSAPETLCTYRLPHILQSFRSLYPQVRLLLRPYPVAELRRRVADGDLDVAFVLEEPVQAMGLTVEQLCNEPIVVVAPPDHRLCREPAVRAADLSGEPLLFTEPGCAYRNLFEQRLIAAGAYPSIVLEFASIEAIKQCVIASMGIAVLPAVSVAAERAYGHLAALRWADLPLEVVSQVIWHPARASSPTLRAFLDVVRQVACRGTSEETLRPRRRSRARTRV